MSLIKKKESGNIKNGAETRSQTSNEDKIKEDD